MLCVDIREAMGLRWSLVAPEGCEAVGVRDPRSSGDDLEQ